MRLAQAEVSESNPHVCDDPRIARLTVAYAASGEAVFCSPHVLASYMVLGLHPEKVWPAILARRKALVGPLDISAAPPKKPPRAVKLWCEKHERRESINSRGAMQYGSPRTSTDEPMAAPSIAALYPNPDAPSSAKKGSYTLRELETIVAHSGAPPTVVAVTLAALSARGAWPNENGAATTTLCVALKGLMYDSKPSCCRRTAQRRIKRALNLQYWRRLRDGHSWMDCPKCGAKRTSGKCECGYKGRSKDAKGNWTGEFMRVPTYEFDVDKFRRAPRCKELQQFPFRTYAEYKEAAKRGEHPNVTEMPARKPTQPAPPDPPPATAAPVRQPAAEHAHRNSTRIQPKLSKTEAAKFVGDMVALMRGQGQAPGRTEPDPACEKCHGEGRYETTAHPGQLNRCWCWAPADPNYRAPMSQRDAILALCQRWRREPRAVVEALKFWAYKIEPGEFSQ